MTAANIRASARARDLLRQVHLWVGLALCLPLIGLGLSGSVLVFEDELRGLLKGPAPASAPGQAMNHSIVDMIAAARVAAPTEYVPATYMAPLKPGEPASLRLAVPRGNGPPADAVRVEIDPATLQATVETPDWLRQISFLHTSLLMKNREGRQWVGYLGVAMLLLGITGLVNWWPRWRQWRAAFTVGRDANGYRLHRELHGAAGIWGLLVFITVSFGGVQLAFPESIRTLVDAILPARDLRGAANAIRVEPVKGGSPMSVDEAVALVQATYPDTRLRFVALPARPEQPIRVTLLRDGQDKRVPLLNAFVDPWQRRIIEVQDPRTFSAGESLLAWQHPMHAGQGFGPVWKLLVFLSGLLPLLFSATGLSMWLLKRRRRRAAISAEAPLIDRTYTARRAGE
jgi:uncharacterized iron-regulated membrane protein